ncbi:hypothetical protein GAY28_00215 [Azospirillum brasilense]|nr:hypothetical protein [Azospirillum brasilense]
MLAGTAEGAAGVISIRGTAPEDDMADLDLACAQAVLGEVDAVLVMQFDDIGIDRYGPYSGPTMQHVTAALDFARAARDREPDGTLVVHCLHGRSRSTAIALAILADQHGPGRETEAVAALLRQDEDSRMHPNPLLVSLADAAMLRTGALEQALAEACPRHVKWRDHWRIVALDPQKHWKTTRKVRFRRRGKGGDT